MPVNQSSDMLIAYYDLGNISNPIGTIHDKNGKPILKKKEIEIFKENEARCKLIKIKSKKTWSKIGSPIIFHDIGVGKLIRTDKRLIYLRVPEYEKYVGGKIKSSDLGLLAKAWKREGKMECISLPIIEIIKIKRFKNAARFYVEHNENRYRLLILSENINKI